MALDASDYVSGASDAADASEDVGGATGDMSESLWDVEPAGMAAGGALAGLATAGQGILDSTRETREGLDRTAETMGITSDAARDLATDMSDATFSLDEAEGTMDSLASMGVDSADDMEDLALQMDEIGDATGNTADSVTDAVGPALRAMGEDVEDVGEHADTFTHIAENTTMELDEFSQMTTKLGPELQEMEMGVDDTAAIMGALEEKGMDSRTAMSEFRQATNDADGDQEELMDSLGLTSEELEDQHGALEDAEGMTKDHAEAANDNVSTMDELRASFADAKLSASGYLGPLESLMPAAQAAGIALMGMSAVNVGTVAPSFATVSAAAAPITAVVLGLAAAGAALYAAWSRDIGGVQGKTETATAAIMDGLEWLVDGVEWAIDTADYILTDWSPGETLSNAKEEMLSPMRDVREAIPSDIDEATGLALDIFRSWHPAGIVWNKRDEIMDALPGASDARDAAGSFTDGFADGIRDNIPDVTGAVDSMTDAASDYLPSSDAEKGEFSRLTDAGKAVPETIGSSSEKNSDALADGIGSTVESVDDVPSNATGSGSSPSGGRDTSRTEELLERIAMLLETLELDIEGELEINNRRFNDLFEARLRKAGRQARN
ncbi:phage tail tape measure protein [Natronorubrum sp. JWXQ-INN-674]|uniref:Phage tail tape measure protein n=2 Tax=Natronorubrum halalkaliphilum TaxID=2691917 RepID=A0A6B0VJS8_9EURY|nr:phage tail tape measure protein [Natronorubrum halalkaliphilum]